MVSWLVGLAAVLAGCSPTGPTPVRLQVPTPVVQRVPVRRTATSLPVPPATLTVAEAAQATVQRPATATPEPTSPPPTAPPVRTAMSPGPEGPATLARGWTVTTLVPGGRVTAPAAGPDSVLWVAPAGEGLGLYFSDLTTGAERLLLAPSVPGGCVCRGRRAGDWVVATETLAGGLWWEVRALDMAGDGWLPVGRTQDPAVRDELWPGEADADKRGRVVWKDLDTRPNGSVVQILWLRNMVTGATTEVTRVASPTRIEHVAMQGDWIVWTQATEKPAGTRGDVFAYTISGDQVLPIGETGRAWQPAVWGHRVVWKHADGPFADGDVYLFDLSTGQGRFLTDAGAVSDLGIGDGFAVWSSMTDGVVVVYDLETGEMQTVGRGPVGRLHAAANVVVWQLDTQPNVLYVAWQR